MLEGEPEEEPHIVEADFLNKTVVEKDEALIAWIESQAKQEQNRLKSYGLTTLLMIPKNYGLVVDIESHISGKPILINRIEFSTQFQFDRVKHVQLGPPTSCRAAYTPSTLPMKLNSTPSCPSSSHFDYRHIILSCGSSPASSPVYIIVPYIYPSVLKWKHPKHGHKYHLRNKLDEWLFINSKFQRARLKVSIN